MRLIPRSLGRALKSIARPGVLIHLLWPGIVSGVLWLIVAWFAWTPVASFIMGCLGDLAWVGGFIEKWNWVNTLTSFLVKLTLIIILGLLFYLTSMLIVEVFALPVIVEKVARRDYTDLEQKNGGSNRGSIMNMIRVFVFFIVFMGVTLPLWLIPGGSIVLLFLGSSWLSQRIMSYDCLMKNADAEELLRIRKAYRIRLMALGGCTMVLAYIPLINIFSSAFSCLAFLHYLLETLRRDRARRGVKPVSATLFNHSGGSEALT